jgi:hypothetical protein
MTSGAGVAECHVVDPQSDGGAPTPSFSEPATGSGSPQPHEIGNRLHLGARIWKRVRNFETRHDIRPNVLVKVLQSRCGKSRIPTNKSHDPASNAARDKAREPLRFPSSSPGRVVVEAGKALCDMPPLPLPRRSTRSHCTPWWSLP